jgi:hypothetical protein
MLQTAYFMDTKISGTFSELKKKNNLDEYCKMLLMIISNKYLDSNKYWVQQIFTIWASWVLKDAEL